MQYSTPRLGPPRLDGAGYSSGTQKVSVAGTTVACNRLLEPRSPPSSSYTSGSANLTSITRPCVISTNGERSVRPAAARPRVRPHCRAPSGGGDPDVEVAVVGPGVVESADAAGDGADVAEQDAGCRPVEPFPTVDADLRRHGLVPHVAQPGQHVREPPGPVLQPAVCVIDHLCVESGPGHDGEVFAVQLAEVEPAARTVEGYAHGLRQVGRDTEVAGELVRGAGWDDRDGGVRAGEPVHAPLNHAVAAPHEYQIDTVLERAPGPLARLAALGHLVPDGVVEPFVCDQLPEFVETATDGLLPVGDDGDPYVLVLKRGVHGSLTYPLVWRARCGLDPGAVVGGVSKLGVRVITRPALQRVDHDRADIDARTDARSPADRPGSRR